MRLSNSFSQIPQHVFMIQFTQQSLISISITKVDSLSSHYVTKFSQDISLLLYTKYILSSHYLWCGWYNGTPVWRRV